MDIQKTNLILINKILKIMKNGKPPLVIIPTDKKGKEVSTKDGEN